MDRPGSGGDGRGGRDPRYAKLLTSGRPIRVLVLSPIPEEGAGCRFRIAQFIPYLEANGFEVTLSPLYTTDFFRRVYKPGQRLRKSVEFAGLSLKRLTSLRRVTRFDVVFIYREIFPIGPAIVERLLSLLSRAPIVFDYDDAIFLPSVSGVSEANRFIAAWKFPGKVATIIRLSDQVITGNEYLAAYARRFSAAVTVIPTCVDTTKCVPRSDRAAGATNGSRRLIVGWIGSPTTALYLRSLGGVLRRLATTHPFVLRTSGAGQAIELPGVDVENPPWTMDGEVRLFNTCDIGVYPLPDDEWAKGKCGFKAIEFMACGVPVVAAAVGVNREIIEDGVNGFLASTESEWVAKLQRLLDDPALRARFAEAGRRTVEERYSLRVCAPRLAAVIRAATGRQAPEHRVG
jgi:glycosyltransferase involved in cell wall biosynthesis